MYTNPFFNLPATGVSTNWSASLISGFIVTDMGDDFISGFFPDPGEEFWQVFVADSFGAPGLVCPCNLSSHYSSEIDFEVLATPLPAALPLFVSGLGLMGWFARRKKRKAAAWSTA